MAAAVLAQTVAVVVDACEAAAERSSARVSVGAAEVAALALPSHGHGRGNGDEDEDDGAAARSALRTSGGADSSALDPRTPRQVARQVCWNSKPFFCPQRISDF